MKPGRNYRRKNKKVVLKVIISKGIIDRLSRKNKIIIESMKKKKINYYQNVLKKR